MKSVFMTEVPYFSDPISNYSSNKADSVCDMLMCKMPSSKRIWGKPPPAVIS